jgi:hypothetical protein
MNNVWEVDGKDLFKMDKTETDDFVEYLLIKIKDRINDGSLFVTDLVGLFQYDDFEYDPLSCDQCGSSTSTTTWKI